MNTLTADANLKSLFQQIKDVTNVVDDDGRLLGVITPRAHAEKLLYEEIAAAFDIAELEERKSETGGYTLDQIWERVKSLENTQ
jgi:hypothetical protein